MAIAAQQHATVRVIRRAGAAREVFMCKTKSACWPFCKG
jgi:hypothetical protein